MTLIYFIKCFVSMGIAWSIYKLVLADKKSFLFNRGFLLVSIVGLAFVPFLSLPSSVEPVVEPMMPQIENVVAYAVNLNEAPKEVLTEAVSPIIPEEASTRAFNWMWIFYLVGFVLLLRIIYNLAKLSTISYRNHSHSEGAIRIIDSNYKNTPFSFFSNLFLSSKQIEEGLPEEVLAHELCHIYHYHSIDRVVVELILLIQWWNPFAHLLIKSLKENHEFTADDYALRSKGTSNELIDQILSYSTRVNSNQLFQIGFAQHSVLKRIKMIKMEDKKINAVIKMIILPLLIVICFACTTLDNDNAQKLNDDEPTFTIVEYDENKYVYPISLLENFKRGELSTGIISEYRTPNRALFKKFKSDTTFEVVLDMEELPIEKRKYLKHDQIKSFDVSYSPDLSIRLHKVYLYTYKGYFDMAEYRIEQWRTTVMGVTNEGGLFIYPRMLKSNLENYIALPPKEKQPDQQLMIDMMSDEYRIFIDGRAVNDKSIVSQDHKDYYYFYESEQRVSALSQDSESNYYYNEPEKENIRNLILFTKKGYADLVKIYETSKAPELDIIIN